MKSELFYVRLVFWVWLAIFAGLMSLCASGQPVPIKRPAPLHSPKYASTAREVRMRSVITEPPLLPMTGAHYKVQSPYGTEQFYANTIQPANQSVTMELSTDLSPSWIPLAFFPAYPVQQPVYAGITTYEQKIFVRARATPVTASRATPSGMSRVVTTGKAVWWNPALRGATAGRGVK